MKRKMKHIGLIMGAAMMAAVTGAGTALADSQPVKTQKSAVVSASVENKDQETKTDQKEDTKKGTLFYGKVKKVKKNKLVIDEAVVFVETGIEEEKKSPAANTGNKEESTKDASAGTSGPADYETETMKWRLVGKTLKIKTDKDTKYMKSISEDDAKKGNADAQIDNAKSTAVERKDIQEGMFLKITVKDDGTRTASEVLILSDAKKIMPAGK